ncbi:MAG: hypothetical protein ABW221_20730 [Vicinamibacteria bacterium]
MTDHGNPNGIQYEKTDIDIAAVAKLGVAILLVTLVTAGALIPLIGLMKGRAEKHDPPAAALAGFGPDRKPPEPRLQERPFDDWRAMHRQQDELLAGYGWVDESKGIARIPIDEAMKRLAAKGLPARPAAAPAAVAAPVPAPAAPAAHAPVEPHR